MTAPVSRRDLASYTPEDMARDLTEMAAALRANTRRLVNECPVEPSLVDRLRQVYQGLTSVAGEITDILRANPPCPPWCTANHAFGRAHHVGIGNDAMAGHGFVFVNVTWTERVHTAPMAQLIHVPPPGEGTGDGLLVNGYEALALAAIAEARGDGVLAELLRSAVDVIEGKAPGTGREATEGGEPR